jgi:hypothetical protein
VFRQLSTLADRLAEPALNKLRQQVHRFLMAAATLALAIGCLIAGLAYLASSVWHALVPMLGTVGADLVLGAVYVILATTLFWMGSKLAK